MSELFRPKLLGVVLLIFLYIFEYADLTDTFNILFEEPALRKMQPKQACCIGNTRSFLGERPHAQWMAYWDSSGFIKRDHGHICPTLFRNLPWWIPRMDSETSMTEKETCVWLFLGSRERRVLSSGCTALRCWKTSVWLGRRFLEPHWVLLCLANWIIFSSLYPCQRGSRWD